MASIVFETQAPIFVWFVAPLAFEFWWDARKAADAATPGKELPPTPVFQVDQPWLATRGVAFLWSVATAGLFAFFAGVKADVSLLGLPYWIPLGAMIIGNIGPRGLWLGYHLFGGRDSPRLRSALAYAVLTMILLYLFQYFRSGRPYAVFIAEYFTPGGLGNRSEFNTVTPEPAFTPVLQLIGYLIGAAILTLPTSRR